MKKVIFSRKVIFSVSLLVVLFLIVFPHSSRASVESDLVGLDTTVTETFILHQKVSISTVNVCVEGSTITRVNEVKYYLNGSVKSIYDESCDYETELVQYSKEGFVKESSTSSISLTGINSSVVKYNDYGYQTLNQSILDNLKLEVKTVYDEQQISKHTESEYYYGQLVSEEISNYNRGIISDITLEHYNISNEVTYSLENTFSELGNLMTNQEKTYNSLLILIENSEYTKNDDGVTTYSLLEVFNDQGYLTESTKEIKNNEGFTTLEDAKEYNGDRLVFYNTLTYNELNVISRIQLFDDILGNNKSFNATCDDTGLCTLDNYKTNDFEFKKSTSDYKFTNTGETSYTNVTIDEFELNGLNQMILDLEAYGNEQ
jgi:hypothetical protein